MGYGPSVAGVMFYDQAMGFCTVAEFLIMVGASAGAVLNAVPGIIVQVILIPILVIGLEKIVNSKN
jgi:hypothetical protein